jgi:hypothetical protein
MVELSMPVPEVIFSPVILADPVSIVELMSPLGGVVVPWANDCATVNVPAIREAVARILAIANKYI